MHRILVFLEQVTYNPDTLVKGVVEHLRAVQFALIGTSIVLIVGALSIKPYDPATALREVNEIILLKKLWSPNFLVDTFFITGIDGMR